MTPTTRIRSKKESMDVSEPLDGLVALPIGATVSAGKDKWTVRSVELQLEPETILWNWVERD